MPRFNRDGRSNKFFHMVKGQQGNQLDQDDRNRFKFTVSRGGIQKSRLGAFSRLDATGDTVMEPSGDAGPSHGHGRGHVHFEPRGGKRHGNRTWRKNQQGHGGQNQYNQQGRKDIHSFGAKWHRINIMNGKAYDKTFILPAIAQNCRLSFVPVCYSVFGANTAFFVENRQMAEAIAECSGKILAPDGQNRIMLRVVNTGSPPTAHIDEECEGKIKSVLDKRYNPALHTLSLENFVNDPELVNDYFLPLYRPSVVQKLTDMLQPFLDSIIGLDLSNNRLPALEGLSKMVNKATSLKALNLMGNNLRDVTSLDRISCPGLIELIINDNPLCDNIEDRETFISAVRKRFPKLMKLDGTELAQPLSFDVNEPSKMPETLGSSFCNEQAKGVVLQFWECYRAIYDSDDRQRLLDAYHDMARMSMMSAYNTAHVSQIESSKKLSHYLQDSRNLLKQNDKLRRFKLLHHGKLDIVAFLSKLPKTTHDPNSYIIDMPVAVESFILFTITGILKERDERGTPYRYFSRTFTLIRQNAGFVIVNEMLFVTNPTPDQVKNAFRQPAPTPSPSPVPHVQVGIPPQAPNDDQKRQMLVLFSQQSGMNDEWSRKCLEEYAWDFNNSALAFTQLKEQNKIPPEAFIK